ncbi:ICOS ligand-like isoform X2 [Alosa sapidissima]|uniref:ICOS ligand-like isoform X2 n=1 Tax=Alosa sapidissima TaxID=34773 RepID=UPI001C0925E1|nr:ICOS ligand-like isoform X2 [Alosa sapidissima]
MHGNHFLIYRAAKSHGWFSLEMRMAGQYLFNWIVICILLEGKIYGAVVQEQHESLQQVTVGQRALLPCLLPLPRPSLGNIRVYWQTDKTDLVVHVFNKGQEEFGHQSSTYHNRTQLFTSQLQFGNFSLELCNVSEQDNLTTFQCIAFYDGSGRPKYQNTTVEKSGVIPLLKMSALLEFTFLKRKVDRLRDQEQQDESESTQRDQHQ